MDDKRGMERFYYFQKGLSEVLQKERMERGWTLDEFAYESRISVNHLKKIIARKANPSFKVLLNISFILKIPLSEIFLKVEDYVKGEIKNVSIL